jgi:prepilin-type processing-associated H-X9-DG protein
MTAALSCGGYPVPFFAPAVGVIRKRKTHNMTKAEKLSEFHLRQFTGTENWYRHGNNRSILFADGAKYVADEAGACWLLDSIARDRPVHRLSLALGIRIGVPAQYHA